MRISDWSSDVCSSDLKRGKADKDVPARNQMTPEEQEARRNRLKVLIKLGKDRGYLTYGEINDHLHDDLVDAEAIDGIRSEEHTSELQSLMRISYAVFCLNKKKQQDKNKIIT